MIDTKRKYKSLWMMDQRIPTVKSMKSVIYSNQKLNLKIIIFVRNYAIDYTWEDWESLCINWICLRTIKCYSDESQIWTYTNVTVES